MGRYKSIQEVKELWRQEPDDNAVFKAATEDIDEYQTEVQDVIKEEAERRRKLKQKETEEMKGEVEKKEKGWFGAMNWKEKMVWVVAIIVYATLYEPFLSRFPKIVRIGLAAAFGVIVAAIAVLLTAVFRDKKPKDEQKQ